MKKRPKIKISPKGKAPLKIEKRKSTLGFMVVVKKQKLLFAGLLLIGLSLMLILSVLLKGGEVEKTPIVDEPSESSKEVKEPIRDEMESLSLSELLAKAKQQEGYRQKMTVLDEVTQIETMLSKEGLPKGIVNELVYLAEGEGIDRLTLGKTWYTIKSEAGDESLRQFFIYEASPSQYYVIRALPKPEIEFIAKDEEIKIKSIAGVVKTSLWDAVRDSKGDDRVIGKMEDALKWVVDFYRIKPNDKFKVIYEEKWVEDRLVGVGKLLGVTFYTNKKRYDAFYFKDDNVEGYFDRKGQSMKKKFLKSPVKYNKITSPYSFARVHPVLKDVRKHLGTDFYAKKGDPIFATADGEITIAGFRKNNGNYIKIKHDDIYETQYLHIMDNGFADGIKVGTQVKQGQVIGYAGMTGLATGVHVCYRFWKNGKQVNPLDEEVVQAEVPALLNKEAFEVKKDSLLDQLYDIPYFDLSF